MFRACCSLLAVRCSIVIVSVLDVCCLLLSVSWLLLAFCVACLFLLLCVACYVLFAVYCCSLLIVRCLLFARCSLLLVVCC